MLLVRKSCCFIHDRKQVVGWPPIRSYRKNTLATSSRNTNPLFVKVSMDGAPYLRKVNLRTYTTYKELSLGLEKMFSSFTLGNLLCLKFITLFPLAVTG